MNMKGTKPLVRNLITDEVVVDNDVLHLGKEDKVRTKILHPNHHNRLLV